MKPYVGAQFIVPNLKQGRYMMQQGETLLQVSGIGKNFGGLAALSQVSLYIKRNEIHGLIGPQWCR